MTILKLISVCCLILLSNCVSTPPLFYAADGLSQGELESFFEEDSLVLEMKYFQACVEEFTILRVENWAEINKEGVVGVKALIDPAGKLAAATVFNSVHPALDSAALNSVKSATYISSDRILNIDGSYVIGMMIPYYKTKFDMGELSILDELLFGERMYDTAPEPVEGWNDVSLGINFKASPGMQSIEGETQITFFVDTKGNVGNFYIEKPFGYGAEEKAIEVIRRIAWKPAVKDGVLVPGAISIPFHFYYYF